MDIKKTMSTRFLDAQDSKSKNLDIRLLPEFVASRVGGTCKVLDEIKDEKIRAEITHCKNGTSAVNAINNFFLKNGYEFNELRSHAAGRERVYSGRNGAPRYNVLYTLGGDDRVLMTIVEENGKK